MEDINCKYESKYCDPISIEGTEIIIRQMKKAICKIYTYDGLIGTGFFCWIPYKKIIIPVLITNNHVIGEDYFYRGKKIEISIDDDKNIFQLKENYYRKIYSNELFDVTIIEIMKEDNISMDDFWEVDKDLLSMDEEKLKIYINRSIYELHYPKGTIAMVSYGIIKDTDSDNNYNIMHLCKTDKSSSGSPLLDIKSNKVIGIHIGRRRNMYISVGTFLNFPIMNLLMILI